MINLRYKILREPLGLTFSDEYLEKDRNDILCACFEKNIMIGCCILTKVNSSTLQLRQMAVDNIHQKAGIGCKLLAFVQLLTKENGFSCIILHARATAVRFYEKNGYVKQGEEFTEVGISHFKMIKHL